jgi:hypothetical protein
MRIAAVARDVCVYLLGAEPGPLEARDEVSTYKGLQGINALLLFGAV